MHKRFAACRLFFWKATILTASKKAVRMVSAEENGAIRNAPTAAKGVEGMKRTRYKKEYPRMMYLYFVGYDEANGAPSFSKFARRAGITVSELESFRKKKEFDAAWRECSEIRRDYLIDNALCKRFDASFTKFLLAEETVSDSSTDFKLTLQVVEDSNGI